MYRVRWSLPCNLQLSTALSVFKQENRKRVGGEGRLMKSYAVLPGPREVTVCMYTVNRGHGNGELTAERESLRPIQANCGWELRGG